MSDTKFRYTKNHLEFLDWIKTPDSNIKCLMPPIYDVVKENWEQVVLNNFEKENIDIQYCDITLVRNNIEYPQYYEFYNPNLFKNVRLIDSPLFFKHNQPIEIEFNDKIKVCHPYYILSKLYNQLEIHHIPQCLFKVVRNDYNEEDIMADLQIIYNENNQ